MTCCHSVIQCECWQHERGSVVTAWYRLTVTFMRDCLLSMRDKEWLLSILETVYCHCVIQSACWQHERWSGFTARYKLTVAVLRDVLISLWYGVNVDSMEDDKLSLCDTLWILTAWEMVCCYCVIRIECWQHERWAAVIAWYRVEVNRMIDDLL